MIADAGEDQIDRLEGALRLAGKRQAVALQPGFRGPDRFVAKVVCEDEAHGADGDGEEGRGHGQNPGRAMGTEP